MSKITSKLQITIPKMIADQYGLRPGDEVDWQVLGNSIRMVPLKPTRQRELSREERLRIFRETEAENKKRRFKVRPEGSDRGWKREDLYTRGGSR